MFPTWVYVVVAFSTALVAFGIGQIAPGLGIMFIALASTMWSAYSAIRQKHLKRDR